VREAVGVFERTVGEDSPLLAGALGVYAFSRFLWMDTNAQRAKPARIYSAEGHARPTSVAPFSPTLSESEYKSLIDR